jgi:hypothetical protein
MKDRDDKMTPEKQRVREAIREVGPVRADPAFRERLKRDFVSGTIGERKAPAKPRFFLLPAWQFASMLVAAVAAWLLIQVFQAPSWQIHAVLGKGWIKVDDRQVDARDFEPLDELVRPGARIRVDEEAALDIRGGDVILIELAGGSDVTLPGAPRRWFAKPLESVLHSGEIRLQTGPGFAGHTLTVRTAEGRIRVTGTALSVYKGDDFTCVCVLEGTARIGKDEARMEDVGAGLRKVMFSGDRPSKVVDIEPHHAEELVKFLERNAGVFPSH